MVSNDGDMNLIILSAILLLPGRLQIVECSFDREMVCALTMYPTANELDWNCPEHYQYYHNAGLYVPRDMLPTRFQTHEEITFLAFPRYRCGVAATLVSVKMDDYCRMDPVLTPFPSWELNNSTTDGGLVNVIDVFLDDFNVLWVLDIGVIHTLTDNPEIITSPKVIGFCPKTGMITQRILLLGLVCKQSRLQHLQVEIADDGKTFVYISDGGTGSIIVWDVEQQTGYKVVLPSDVTDYPLTKDVLYIALIKKECGQSVLYFTYLMGRRMYSIRTCLIRYGKVEGAVILVGNKPGPMVILGTDGGQTMYLRMRKEPEIFMWNTDKPFRPRSMVLVERSRLPRYPTHVAPGVRRLMWQLDSNFHDYMANQHSSLGALPRLKPMVKFCDSVT